MGSLRHRFDWSQRQPLTSAEVFGVASHQENMNVFLCPTRRRHSAIVRWDRRFRWSNGQVYPHVFRKLSEREHAVCILLGNSAVQVKLIWWVLYSNALVSRTAWHCANRKETNGKKALLNMRGFVTTFFATTSRLWWCTGCSGAAIVFFFHRGRIENQTVLKCKNPEAVFPHYR